jgi:hypothetical protein
MNLINLSPYEAGITIATDKYGHEHVLVVAKGTFTINPNGTCTVAKEQHPLVYADEFYGEPGLSSVRYETDFALFKHKTDVILNGSAYSPGGKQAISVDVSLAVGKIQKTIRVFGDRVWIDTLLGSYKPTDPKPFHSIPLVYERAFGGGDQSHEKEQKHAFETSNLVGVGFFKYVDKRIVGTFLPNLEHPQHLIRHPKDKPPPVGFGFIGRNWRPRVSYAGTYDQVWMDERYPFLPLDFDDRYFQGAPEDQICDYLQGGELIRLRNLSPEGRLEFRLPALNIPMKLFYSSRQEEVSHKLDTVIIEPDLKRCILTWRASARLRGKLSHLHEIWIGTPSRARELALETGKSYVDWSEPEI